MKTVQCSYEELADAQQGPYPPFPGHVPLGAHLHHTSIEVSGPGHMPPTSFDHKRPLPSSPLACLVYPTRNPVVYTHDAYSELSDALSEAGSNSHILIPPIMPYNSPAYESLPLILSEPASVTGTQIFDGGDEALPFINTGAIAAATSEPMWSLQQLIKRDEEEKEAKERRDAQIQAALAQAQENN